MSVREVNHAKTLILKQITWLKVTILNDSSTAGNWSCNVVSPSNYCIGYETKESLIHLEKNIHSNKNLNPKLKTQYLRWKKKDSNKMKEETIETENNKKNKNGFSNEKRVR